MYTSNLRRVGGSVMLAVPPAILDMVQLQSGSSVSLMVESGRLIVSPEPKKKYSLQELLTQCDASAPYRRLTMRGQARLLWARS